MIALSSVSSPELQAAAAQVAIAEATNRPESVELLMEFADRVSEEADATELDIEEMGLVELLKNALLEASDHWPSEAGTGKIIAKAEEASRHLGTVVLTSSELLLEPELRQELDNLENGQSLDLTAVYDRYELREDERKILSRRLAERPKAIPSSVVDIAREAIIRLPSPGFGRVLRYSMPVLLIAICVGLFYTLSAMFGNDSGLGDFGDLLKAAGW